MFFRKRKIVWRDIRGVGPMIWNTTFSPWHWTINLRQCGLYASAWIVPHANINSLTALPPIIGIQRLVWDHQGIPRQAYYSTPRRRPATPVCKMALSSTPLIILMPSTRKMADDGWNVRRKLFTTPIGFSHCPTWIALRISLRRITSIVTNIGRSAASRCF